MIFGVLRGVTSVLEKRLFSMKTTTNRYPQPQAFNETEIESTYFEQNGIMVYSFLTQSLPTCYPA